MNTQLSVFDFVPGFTVNEELRKQRFLIKEYDIDFLGFWYYLTPYKCCGCYPKLKHKYVGNYNELCFCQCENCGRSTEPIDDYSWIGTKHNWDLMMKGLKND